MIQQCTVKRLHHLAGALGGLADEVGAIAPWAGGDVLGSTLAGGWGGAAALVAGA